MDACASSRISCRVSAYKPYLADPSTQAWNFRGGKPFSRVCYRRVQLGFRASATLVSVEPCQAKLLPNSWPQAANLSGVVRVAFSFHRSRSFDRDSQLRCPNPRNYSSSHGSSRIRNHLHVEGIERTFGSVFDKVPEDPLFLGKFSDTVKMKRKIKQIFRYWITHRIKNYRKELFFSGVSRYLRLF